ncbi:MAG: hypothetical protein AAF738_11475, partial [Bacteroidota bacterium]
GFLINNVRQDCTPYFVTAQHCNISAGSAPSVVVYWNFEHSTCREISSSENGLPGNGPLNDFNSGATLLASNGASDMNLLLLDDPVSATANAYFAGWNRSVTMPESTVCVHHPDTEEKRISFDYDPPYVGTWEDEAEAVPSGNHIVVADWDLGSTEGGSSGAPLFDQDGLVIGQLHGGRASCDNDSYDSYGWIRASWEGGGTSSTSLKSWLDPDDLGFEVLPGKWNTNCTQALILDTYTLDTCEDAPALITITVADSQVSNMPFQLRTANLPAAVSANFSQNSIRTGESVQLSLDNLAAIEGQNAVFDIIAENADGEFTTFVQLNVFSNTNQRPTLLSPENNEASPVDNPTLTWIAFQRGTLYDLQVSTNASFSTLVLEQNNLNLNTFKSPILNTNTQFFWRVRSRNACGTSAWSIPSVFKTLNCMRHTPNDLPISIDDGLP